MTFDPEARLHHVLQLAEGPAHAVQGDVVRVVVPRVEGHDQIGLELAPPAPVVEQRLVGSVAAHAGVDHLHRNAELPRHALFEAGAEGLLVGHLEAGHDRVAEQQHAQAVGGRRGRLGASQAEGVDPDR